MWTEGQHRLLWGASHTCPTLSDWTEAGRMTESQFEFRQVENHFVLFTSSNSALRGLLSLRGVKWQEREVGHSVPASVEVKKTWIYPSTPPYVFMITSAFTDTLDYTSGRSVKIGLQRRSSQSVNTLCFVFPLEMASREALRPSSRGSCPGRQHSLVTDCLMQSRAFRKWRWTMAVSTLAVSVTPT
jgi:hypothetical protein